MLPNYSHTKISYLALMFYYRNYTKRKIIWRMCVTIDGVWIDACIYWQLIHTTCNYSATVDLHKSQITTVPAKSFPDCCVLTILFLATALTMEIFQLHALRSYLHSLLCRIQFNWQLVKIKVMLRQAVSRPVCRGIKHPSGDYDHIFITVRQLRVCCCGALYLTRGLVCRLQLLLVLASAVILGSESRGLATTFYCLRFETSLFVASYDSQGYDGGIRAPSTRDIDN
jgi:hypothetical protein